MGVIRGSSFYTVVDGPSWKDAQSEAENIGGNLATINSAEENNWLVSQFDIKGMHDDQTKSNDYSAIAYWIGYTDEGSEGLWSWASGEVSSYTKWHDDRHLGGQLSPNGGAGENYAYLGGYTDKTWDDQPNIFGHRDFTIRGIAEVPLSYFSVSDLTIEEGEKGKVTISRTGGTQSSQTLTLSTSDGSAVVGDDYGRKNKTLTFAAGETSKTVNIVSKEDDLVEGNETFTLTLSASGADAVPAQISDGTATVTITDDDVVLPSYYSIGDVQGYEGDTLYALVSRTGNVSTAHTLSLSASNGTAFSGFDFVAPSSTVSFAAGESSKLVAIQTIEDSLVESDETFSLSLSAISSGAEISDGSATLTILNDDSNTKLLSVVHLQR